MKTRNKTTERKLIQDNTVNYGKHQCILRGIYISSQERMDAKLRSKVANSELTSVSLEALLNAYESHKRLGPAGTESMAKNRLTPAMPDSAPHR